MSRRSHNKKNPNPLTLAKVGQAVKPGYSKWFFPIVIGTGAVLWAGWTVFGNRDESERDQLDMDVVTEGEKFLSDTYLALGGNALQVGGMVLTATGSLLGGASLILSCAAKRQASRINLSFDDAHDDITVLPATRLQKAANIVHPLYLYVPPAVTPLAIIATFLVDKYALSTEQQIDFARALMNISTLTGSGMPLLGQYIGGNFFDDQTQVAVLNLISVILAEVLLPFIAHPVGRAVYGCIQNRKNALKYAPLNSNAESTVPADTRRAQDLTGTSFDASASSAQPGRVARAVAALTNAASSAASHIPGRKHKASNKASEAAVAGSPTTGLLALSGTSTSASAGAPAQNPLLQSAAAGAAPRALYPATNTGSYEQLFARTPLSLDPPEPASAPDVEQQINQLLSAAGLKNLNRAQLNQLNSSPQGPVAALKLLLAAPESHTDFFTVRQLGILRKDAVAATPSGNSASISLFAAEFYSPVGAQTRPTAPAAAPAAAPATARTLTPVVSPHGSGLFGASAQLPGAVVPTPAPTGPIPPVGSPSGSSIFATLGAELRSAANSATGSAGQPSVSPLTPQNFGLGGNG